MTQNTCKQRLSCGFDHFAAVKNILMHLVFQEITIVVSLFLSSYLLMLTSPDLCVFPAATDGVSCGVRWPCRKAHVLGFPAWNKRIY